jgi:hypothetical protein
VYGSFCFESFDDRGQQKKTALLQPSKKKRAFGRSFSVLKFQLFESGMSLNSQRSMLSGFFLLPQLEFF